MSLINTRDVLNSEATNRGPASTTHLNILTGRSEELGSPLPQPEGAIFPVSNNDNHSNNNRNEKVQGLGESTSSAQQNAANSSLAIKSERLSQDHEEEDEDGYVPGGIRPARRWCQTCLRTMKGPCRNKRSMASSACINCMYNCHNRDCEEVSLSTFLPCSLPPGLTVTPFLGSGRLNPDDYRKNEGGCSGHLIK